MSNSLPKNMQRDFAPKKRSLSEEQEALAFDYHENLSSIVRDLKAIDRLIPAESSRHGCLFDHKSEGEAAAIIEARKADLLSYIQSICRDHVWFSERLMKRGWKVEHSKPKKKRKHGKASR